MIKKSLAIVFGSLILSIGINAFLVPFHLLDGGMIGLALILHYFWDVQAGLAMILLSCPLFIYAWFKQRTYFYNSLHGLLVSSLMIDWLSPLRYAFSFPLPLSSLAGGLFIGAGIGLMLRFETSTGGTDLIAQMISKAMKLNVGAVIFLVDGIVVLLGYKVIGLEGFLYSCVVICIVGLTTSLIVSRQE
ncbi:hypothetical protein E2R51_03665 [Jeotgalibacillus sp. S-D1]|uniref:YitT family protein n=1 Tax=Jeotgalibacillus sp. S-D1 TaxID=2552189 RepID=UPI00105A19D5|nr:YitT family protein [Jeotgalibacillus sp. S-D1]TDL34830.1 hypothetical protein E2R51_03665 [Jeotgalibacillus sp. S-D1]